MEHGFWIEKVANDPELFRICEPASDKYQRGVFQRSTFSLTESELRAELKKMGVTEAQSDMLIQQAREKFDSRGAPAPA
jgi:hypothetical protein